MLKKTFLMKQNEHFNTELCLAAIHRAGFKQTRPLSAVICKLLFWHEGRIFVYRTHKSITVFLEVQLILALHKLKSRGKCMEK